MSDFALVQPPAAASSGGYIYNENIAGHWPDNYGRIEIHELAPSGLAAWCSENKSIKGILFDSLYLEAPQLFDALDCLGETPAYFLIHALPSEIKKHSDKAPARISPPPKALVDTQVSERETAALSKVRGYIATGPLIAQRLNRQGHPGIFAPPGVSRKLFFPKPGENVVSPNGVKFLQKTFTILTVGAVTEHKGQVDIARALAQWSKTKEHSSPTRRIEWIVAGPIRNSRYYKDLCKITEQFGPQISVQFLDDTAQAALPALYRRADIFVLFSKTETWGMAVAEALCCGCPVITSNLAIMRHLWGRETKQWNSSARKGPAKAGYQGSGVTLVDPDNTETIVQTLEQLMDDDAFRDAAVADAKDSAKKIPSWSATAARVAGYISQTQA